MTLLPSHLQYLLYMAYVTPCFLAVIAFFVLLRKKGKSKSHKALMCVFLAAAIIMLVFINQFFYSYAGANHIVLHYPNLLVGVLCAPVIIIYFMSLLRPGIVTRKKVLIYLSPSIFYLIVTIILQITELYPKAYFTRYHFINDIFTVGNIIRLTLGTTYLGQLISYVIVVIHALNKYQRSIKHKYSYNQGVNLQWAYWAMFAVAIFAILPLGMLMSELVQTWMLVAHSITATVAISILFFAGYFQPSLYEDKDTEGYTEDEEAAKKSESLPLDNRQRLRKEILELFEVKKCFMNINLSIDDIAQELKSNRTYISRVVNEEFGMNFYGFVNKYRMAEFMHLLHESGSDNFRIKEVSEQVGFKSYTSFYNFFKEQTGHTPSEYAKKLGNNNRF